MRPGHDAKKVSYEFRACAGLTTGFGWLRVLPGSIPGDPFSGDELALGGARLGSIPGISSLRL